MKDFLAITNLLSCLIFVAGIILLAIKGKAFYVALDLAIFVWVMQHEVQSAAALISAGADYTHSIIISTFTLLWVAVGLISHIVTEHRKGGDAN